MNRLRAAGAAATLAIALLGALLAVAVVDDVRTHRDAAQRAQQARDLNGELLVARAQRDGLDTQLAAMRTQNASLQTEARNPTLAMWDTCGGPCAIGPGTVRVGSVPDTFELLLTFTADVPVRSYVLTFQQWTQFDDCGFAARCVTGAYQSFGATTSLDTTFADAEGCSAYVWVLQADRSGTIVPNVRVHYQPADHPTGACTSG